MPDYVAAVQQAFSDPVLAAWLLFGVTGTIVFNSRFYVQWYVSEREKRSVVPVSFWYLSSIGATILLIYAIHEQSPNGGLSYSLNTIIYSRNLVHIWREKGSLTRAKSIVFQSLVGLITVVAVTIVVVIWLREIDHIREKPQVEAVTQSLWIAVGVLGSSMFAARFLIQWLATELKRRSVMPHIFWHISFIAALLLFLSFSAQGEWLYALGPVINVPVYARNLWLIYKHREDASEQAGMA